MLNDKDVILFLISTLLIMAFTKKQIESKRKDIDFLDNTIMIGDDIIRGVAKTHSWNNDHTLHTHVFYNAGLAYQTRNRLYI